VPDEIMAVDMDSASETLDRLYEAPFHATRSGPLYNAFSYPTKISPEAIALFIATHTQPGDTVLDVFAGSGTTGVAAKLCDRPTPAMKAHAEQLGIEPEWGPRKAVLYEIGVLGSLVARVMCDPPDPARFAQAAADLVDAAEKTHGWLYEADDPDGAGGTIRHTIWSEILVCPRCDEETTYWDAVVRERPLAFSARYACPGCRADNAVKDCERATETAHDPLLDAPITRRRRVPVRVDGLTGRRRWRRPVETDDETAIERGAASKLPTGTPVAAIEWGDLYRAGYHTGITHLHHFYTPRNFLAIAVLWDLVDDHDEDLRDALRLLILSFNATHSTLMTRVVLKQNQKELVLTSAQSGVLYISGLPVEKNVFIGVRRKATTFAAAFELVHGSESDVSVVNATSAKLDLPRGSVDYVFTDPPFGDYIPYAELNQINELWLGAATDRSREIVMSPAAGKDAKAYGGLMADVFRETARVLADDGLMTVAFHSARADVWQALTNAYASAGLAVRATTVLDKTQASFKQTVSRNGVKGDPLILLDKHSRNPVTASIDEVIARVLDEAERHPLEAERTRERLFSRFVTHCLQGDVAVTLGASEFYLRAGLDAPSR
jgi:16S rRNA G966 N2-methylase RsmD